MSDKGFTPYDEWISSFYETNNCTDVNIEVAFNAGRESMHQEIDALKAERDEALLAVAIAWGSNEEPAKIVEKHDAEVKVKERKKCADVCANMQAPPTMREGGDYTCQEQSAYDCATIDCEEAIMKMED